MIGHLIEWLVLRVLARLFPKRFRLIPNAVTGAPMLRQFKLFEFRRLSCYLQSFVGPEVFDWFHVHRWRRTFSIVMSGEFTEERYPGGLVFYGIRRRALSCYCMDYTTIHRIDSVRPRTWTAFFMFEDRGFGWGYYPRPADPKFIEWRRFIPEARQLPKL